MQRYKIIHRTYYNFTDEVTLGEHRLLLRPREGHEQRIESFSLNISPAATLLWHRDIEDNAVAIASFNQPARQLVIESEAIIQQYNEAPLDFMVAADALNYPFVYQQHDEPMLAPYRTQPDAHTSALLNRWIGTFWRAGENIQTYSLLQRLTGFPVPYLALKGNIDIACASAWQTLVVKPIGVTRCKHWQS